MLSILNIQGVLGDGTLDYKVICNIRDLWMRGWLVCWLLFSLGWWQDFLLSPADDRRISPSLPPSGIDFPGSLCCFVLPIGCVVLYCIVLYCIVLYCYNTIQYNTIQYNTIQYYCIVLYCIVLYCIVSYFRILLWTTGLTSVLALARLGLTTGFPALSSWRQENLAWSSPSGVDFPVGFVVLYRR